MRDETMSNGKILLNFFFFYVQTKGVFHTSNLGYVCVVYSFRSWSAVLLLACFTNLITFYNIFFMRSLVLSTLKSIAINIHMVCYLPTSKLSSYKKRLI